MHANNYLRVQKSNKSLNAADIEKKNYKLEHNTFHRIQIL